MAWQQRLTNRHHARKSVALWRERPLLTSSPSVQVQVNGQWLTNFASNDYLGLAADASLAAEALALNAGSGLGGSSASHVLAGHQLPHHLLEDELADWLGVERVLLFSSGYLANLAVQTAFMQQGDRLIHDKLNHASLIDGALLSGVNFKRYPHNDMSALARRLAEPIEGLTMVVSDGVFSMDGDIVNLPEMIPLVSRDDVLWVVDDAHAFGVLGAAGSGSLSYYEQQHLLVSSASPLVAQTENLLRVGTLGKAFGSSGAFIAGSALLIDTIAQFARSYVYTTAQPPYQASFSRAALRRIQGESGDELRAQLHRLIECFRAGAAQLGLSLMPSLTAIQPILLGSNARVLAWQEALWRLGQWVPAIRPPTVPEGQARLRISLSAAHSMAHIDALLAALAECQQQEPSWR